jgi:hypothetical protein
MQAKFPGHSELMVHSGRQFGERPTKLGKQEQAPVLPITRHCELGPQGDGTHGFIFTVGTSATSVHFVITKTR